mgnify:CR=1 FL=1
MDPGETQNPWSDERHRQFYAERRAEDAAWEKERAPRLAEEAAARQKLAEHAGRDRASGQAQLAAMDGLFAAIRATGAPYRDPNKRDDEDRNTQGAQWERQEQEHHERLTGTGH